MVPREPKPPRGPQTPNAHFDKHTESLAAQWDVGTGPEVVGPPLKMTRKTTLTPEQVDKRDQLLSLGYERDRLLPKVQALVREIENRESMEKPRPASLNRLENDRRLHEELSAQLSEVEAKVGQIQEELREELKSR